MQSSSSKLLDKAVEQFASLPGIGRKTALKFVLHLLKKSPQEVNNFIQSIQELKTNIRECRKCHNIADSELCEICADTQRDAHTICVVENLKDILSIEATSQFHGLYHVLGGIISPMDGIGPADLHIDSLLQRIEQEEIKEIILALSATIEGDTTGYYIFKKLKNKQELVI
ncbi:MAG: recombination mediator RecR, partial [Odoribacter sp.]|nr:recombination mediator RecR [Odoribacter sp.]